MPVRLFCRTCNALQPYSASLSGGAKERPFFAYKRFFACICLLRAERFKVLCFRLYKIMNKRLKYPLRNGLVCVIIFSRGKIERKRI